MTENDYSIKPLPNLPNVTGLNPARENESRRERRNTRKRKAEPSRPTDLETDINNDCNEDEEQLPDDQRHHIDFRA